MQYELLLCFNETIGAALMFLLGKYIAKDVCHDPSVQFKNILSQEMDPKQKQMYSFTVAA